MLVMAKMGADGDFQQRFLLMFEVDESGFIWRAHSFDDDHIDDAVALLDEWFIESLDPVRALSFDIGLRVVDAGGDLEQLASMLSADCIVSDKRLGSFGISTVTATSSV